MSVRPLSIACFRLSASLIGVRLAVRRSDPFLSYIIE
jgi:hypothetical protein